MRHSAWKRSILLSLFAVAAACGDDNNDASSDSAATAEASGSGASSNTTAGRSSSAVTAGRGGNTALAGRSSNSSTPSAGASGSTVTVIAGRPGSSAAGRGGTLATPPSGGTGGSQGGAGQTAQSSSDEEVVAILTAVNNAEVQQGNVAASKAVSPAVRTYAQDLVDMHMAAQTRLNVSITTASLTPMESATSSELTKTASQLVTKLQAASLDAFDMTFIQAQIDAHRQVLALIDERLLPNVKSDTVRSELALTREAVVQHLNRGRAIAATLELSVDAGPEADAGI